MSNGYIGTSAADRPSEREEAPRGEWTAPVLKVLLVEDAQGNAGGGIYDGFGYS